MDTIIMDVVYMALISAAVIATIYCPFLYMAWRDTSHQRRLRKIKQRAEVAVEIRKAAILKRKLQIGDSASSWD